MNRLTAMKNGNMTRFTIIVDGKEIDFRLCVILTKNWCNENEYGFMFVSTDNKLSCTSCYSGGNTGGGADYINNASELIIVTDDIEKMQALAIEADAMAIQSREDRDANIQKTVELINQLPIEYSVCTTPDFEVKVIRSKAEYRPSYSGKFLPSYNVSVKRTNGYESTLWLSNYYRKDGVLLKKKAIEDYGSLGIMIIKAAADTIDKCKVEVSKILSANNVSQRF